MPWGGRDDMTVVTLEEQKVLWERAKAEHYPWFWDNEKYKVQAGYPPEDVQRYCVNSPSWQKIRLSMKGQPTCMKLAILIAWWKQQTSIQLAEYGMKPAEEFNKHCYYYECQIGNYLGALRRGGQLDDQNRIRKWL